MKDNFSTHANDYAQYRPGYPDALFQYISTLAAGHENAWDCATGNGQAAQKLANFFTHVYATDISQPQLDQAVQLPAIHYSVQPAEKTSFPAHFFDLVMVAQAVHWFQFEKFYAEVVRTARANALLVIAGYGRLSVSPEVDKVIDRLYHDRVGPYWDKERRYIDEMYQTIPFPFDEIKAPPFSIEYNWRLDHLVGYLQTWSAVKHYEKEKGHNPVALLKEELQTAWETAEERRVHFPLLLRVARINRTGKPAFG